VNAVDRFGRAQLVLAASAVAFALAAFVVGAPKGGVLLFSNSDDNFLGHLLQLNSRGAVVYLLAGLLAAAGVLARQRLVVLAAAAVWALLAVQVLIWFPTWTSSANPLGTNRGSNLAFCLMLAVGLVALDWGRERLDGSSGEGGGRR
jgi:hypothetical protein